jgi:hypothetical protein
MKSVKFLFCLLLAATALTAVVGCGGPDAESGPTLQNPEKGDGSSAAGDAHQAGPADSVDAGE